MERVALRNAFHGEPDNEQNAGETEERGPDQVLISVKGGRLELRVPNSLPDDAVITKQGMDQFMRLVLELEDGSELTVTLDASSDMVDTQLVPANERGRESNG